MDRQSQIVMQEEGKDKETEKQRGFILFRTNKTERAGK